MKKIAIFGAGGFGREVHFLIQQINATRQTFEFIGYFDDGKDKGTIINNFPVLGDVNDLNLWEKDLGIVLAIGEPITKQTIIKKINNPLINYPTTYTSKCFTRGYGVQFHRGRINHLCRKYCYG